MRSRGPCREITARSFAVERVIDGDTFVVVYDGEPTSVRLAGIDAPEPREPGGAASTAALKAMIRGRQVTLEFPGPRKRDHFGRLLCRVWCGGVDVNRAMLDGGHATETGRR